MNICIVSLEISFLVVLSGGGFFCYFSTFFFSFFIWVLFILFYFWSKASIEQIANTTGTVVWGELQWHLNKNKTPQPTRQSASLRRRAGGCLRKQDARPPGRAVENASFPRPIFVLKSVHVPPVGQSRDSASLHPVQGCAPVSAASCIRPSPFFFSPVKNKNVKGSGMRTSLIYSR